jgi:hypothetical protein
MRARTFLSLWSFLAVAGSPAFAATPDNPGAPAPPARYSPIISGSKSYRPVEPLPWGDVNRRVAPPVKGPAEAPPKGKENAPAQPGPQHKH